jgi:hypothetical protein
MIWQEVLSRPALCSSCCSRSRQAAGDGYPWSEQVEALRRNLNVRVFKSSNLSLKPKATGLGDGLKPMIFGLHLGYSSKTHGNLSTRTIEGDSWMGQNQQISISEDELSRSSSYSGSFSFCICFMIKGKPKSIVYIHLFKRHTMLSSQSFR